jgi:hypothetical protein
MRDMGDLNGGEVLGIKGSSFFVSPGEGGLVGTDDPFHKFDLFGKKEVLGNCHLFAAFMGDTANGNKFGGIGRQRRHVGEGIRVIAADNMEVLWKGGGNRSSFVGNFLIEEG